MKETLRAYAILDREHLIVNAEKAARVLGIYNVVTQNSTDALWALANSPEDDPVVGSVIVGSEPVLEIVTEDPAGGQAPGIRPTVRRTTKAGR